MTSPTRQKKTNKQDSGLKIREIQPKTRGQRVAFDGYDKGDHLILGGMAGTGKTFISLYLALEEILDTSERSLYKKLIIVRSSVSTRAIGHLPGDDKEKVSVFEEPYVENVAKLFGRGDAYDQLKRRGIIEFSSTSFLRGITFDNAIVFIDEGQNMEYDELSTVLTRAGENTRIILAGDVRQDDLTSARYKTNSGYFDIRAILMTMKNMTHVEFGVSDVVRSGFVKDFLIKRDIFERNIRRDEDKVSKPEQRLGVPARLRAFA